MRAGDLLRQLDQRLLPHLVRALSRLGQRPARPRVLTSAALLSSSPSCSPPSGRPAGNRWATGRWAR
ncbi:hypothetical protein JNW88_24800 [Micromonospora sp. ATA32]|nr:hypothetical protein [Micromonospora sp. ATA32]